MRDSLAMFALLIGCLTFSSTLLMANENPELDDVDIVSTLKVEPEYKSDKPVYAVLAIGKQLDHFVWFVLDKSEADAKTYSQLYVDLNNNGDLTDEGEHFVVNQAAVNTDFPDIELGNESKLTNFNFVLRDAKDAIGMLRLQLDDVRFAGGYPVDPDQYMKFTDDKKEAPLVWFKADEPFEFQRWIDGPLEIGQYNDFKVFLGWRGRGPSSFCSTMGHILPEEEVVLASLQYVDVDGKEKSANFEFAERC